ncbi:5'-3' exonuclease [Sporosarcina sp. Marseille-Q4063]|uniref:5'-3' exonuclease n=1 Tax=Sporosarcina sp. Marseille-Q4063 TaxID=2810514 RepID=UPI001BAE98F6|nr:5'-3' exonuclease [Sporosarcina sp. Marseille-Q4063]QUW23285.1 5'-3' exonuclease [Sporosarcina sp. Marseille-Q4063]
MTTEEKPHILIVDGMALLFRSFFATSAMGHFFPNAAGVPTNGVQGFARHSMTAMSLFNPTHMAVCWDMGAHTFRNDLYDGYKANRPAPPEELVPQFDMARSVSELIGWKSYGEPGMEADDLIGSMVTNWEGKAEITIVSGDRDLLQLLRPGVKVALIKKGYSEYDIYTDERFIEEYGITPLQYIDKKAFTGDAADGYPGVKGIGPKTALTLLKQYGSIEGVLDALDELTPARRKRIEEGMEMLHLSRKLAEIHCDLKVSDQIEDLTLPIYDVEKRSLFEKEGYTMIMRHADSLFS